MSYCHNGTASINLAKEEDRNRFNEILQWENVKGNLDAAADLFYREQAGEIISSATPLLDREPQLVEAITNPEGKEWKDDVDINRVQKVLDSQIKALNKRVNDLKLQSNSLSTSARERREEESKKLDNLLTGIADLEEKQQFTQILDYALKRLTQDYNWLSSDKFDAKKESHRDTILALWKQLDTYAGLNTPEFAAKHSQLSAKINEVNSLYRNTKELVEEKFFDTVVETVIANSNQEGITREDVESFLRESQDIPSLQKWFNDINSSSDKLLAVIAKIHAIKLQEVHDSNKQWEKKINAAGKKLIDSGIKGFDWMLEKVGGKNSGNIIQRVSGQYYDKLSKLYDKLNSTEVGTDGKFMKREYIKKPFEELTEAEKEHNLQLAEDKGELSAFLRPENYNWKEKQFFDGENKKYTDDFKSKRAYYEEYHPAVYEDGVRVIDAEWVKKKGISDEEYQKYKDIYYNEPTTIWRLVRDESGEATGEVEEVEVQFVKDKHTEIREKWNSKEYTAIQNNPAMKEFYDFYTTTFQEILDKLPADVARKMSYKVLRIKDDLMTQAMEKKPSILKRFLRDIKDLFLPEIVTSQRRLDEQNMPINDIGIFYTSDLKNEERIQKLEAEIESLRTATDSASKERLKRLKNSLLIEKNKLTAEDLVYDMVESLKCGMNMATAYDTLKGAESTFLIAQEVIRNKQFYDTDAKGDVILKDGKPQVLKGKSNVEDRLETWMRQVFYNNSQVNNSRMAKLFMLLKKYVSAVNVGGLAIFPAFNNIVTAEMANIQEGFGGRFYTKKNYVRSSKFLAKHLLNPKWATHMFKPIDQYTEEKPYNLFTALIHEFNFLEENADRSAGIKTKQTVGQYIRSGNVLYAFMEGGEYQAQTKTAMAYMDNKLVSVDKDFEYTDFEGNKKKTKDRKIPLLDAYVFDEAKQKLSLREGVQFTAKDRREASYEIRNMNKNIHGNHSSVDKVPIQENWYGELAFQFKRWMPNGIRNRFGKNYYDESLGMEMEGRYRAIKVMLENMGEQMLLFGGGDSSLIGQVPHAIRHAWKSLSPLQQANMKKNAAEASMFGIALALYLIFDAASKGLPPDDEYTLLAVNFLKKQADRSQGELDFFVNPLQWYQQTKNPIAGMRAFGEVAEFISALVGVPYYALTGQSEKLRYVKGTNKGDLKVWKESRDLLPVVKQIGAFKQLNVSGDFFIR